MAEACANSYRTYSIWLATCGRPGATRGAAPSIEGRRCRTGASAPGSGLLGTNTPISKVGASARDSVQGDALVGLVGHQAVCSVSC